MRLELTPKTARVVVTAALLLTIASYIGLWIAGNWATLTDVTRQTDDARTVIFPFHRYGPERALHDDPIAKEMLSYVPIGVRAIYRVVVPLVGVLASTKVVQVLCLLGMLVAALWLTRRSAIGMAAGALLLFLFLRDPFMVGRIGGGLPRSFAFPCLFIWAAGAIGRSRNVRWGAALCAALTYPTCMTILLGAEGLLALRAPLRDRTASGWRSWWQGGLLRNLRAYLLLAVLCVVATLPSIATGRGDSVHTYEQASKEPAFGHKGRLWALPFGDPIKSVSKELLAPLRFSDHSLISRLSEPLSKSDGMPALALLIGLCTLSLLGRIRPPVTGLALAASSLVLYIAARVLAFRLYAPDRFLEYGLHAAVLVSLAEVWLSLRWTWRRLGRASSRALIALVGIVAVWAFLGDGIRDLRSMSIRGPDPLDKFASTLPPNVRFASHPDDAIGIPLFAGRANTGTKETLQPWLVRSWKRQKERAQETLRALYAIDDEDVFRYAEKYGVTHFVINRKRYGTSFVQRSASFEPLTQFATKLLRKRELSALVFEHIPSSAIVFTHGDNVVVDVARLRDAIRGQR
jgi:hypothetical protein